MFRVLFFMSFHYYYYYAEPKMFIVQYRKVFVLNADLDGSFCHFDGSLTTSVVIEYKNIIVFIAIQSMRGAKNRFELE